MWFRTNHSNILPHNLASLPAIWCTEWPFIWHFISDSCVVLMSAQYALASMQRGIALMAPLISVTYDLKNSKGKTVREPIYSMYNLPPLSKAWQWKIWLLSLLFCWFRWFQLIVWTVHAKVHHNNLVNILFQGWKNSHITPKLHGCI